MPLVPSVKPDAVLNVGQTVTFTNSTPMVFNAATLQFALSPDNCRNNPVMMLSCKAYRIAVNVDPNPKAENVVFFSADFTQTILPPIPPGLQLAPINGVDINIFDAEDHYLGQNAPTSGGLTGIGTVDQPLEPVFGGPEEGDPNDLDPGGATFSSPERGSFKVKQKFYDIVVDTTPGINLGFSLTVSLSNELFAAPFELGDLSEPFAGNEGAFGAFPFGPGFGGTEVPQLPSASVLPDSDIAGVGSGINEQFNAPLLDAIGRTRPISATFKAPSGAALVAALVAAPLVLAVLAVWVLRRRRNALI